MTLRIATSVSLSFMKILYVIKYFIFFLWPFSECVSTLGYHIHFKFVCNNTVLPGNFTYHNWQVPSLLSKLYFRYAFSDNFTLIMVFFSLVVSDTNNSVGVPRWVLRLLIWWYYAQDKLGSKSNYHRRIWILNLLYVNLSLWLKPSCGYCTVILIRPEQTAIIHRTC